VLFSLYHNYALLAFLTDQQMSWQSGSTAQYTPEMNTPMNPPYYPPSNDVYMPVSTHPGASLCLCCRAGNAHFTVMLNSVVKLETFGAFRLMLCLTYHHCVCCYDTFLIDENSRVDRRLDV